MFGEGILQISLSVCFSIVHLHSHGLDRILVIFQECERNTVILIKAVSESSERVASIKTCLAEYLLTFFVYGGNKYEGFTVHEVRDFLADLCLGQGFFWVEEVSFFGELEAFLDLSGCDIDLGLQFDELRHGTFIDSEDAIIEHNDNLFFSMSLERGSRRHIDSVKIFCCEGNGFDPTLS